MGRVSYSGQYGIYTSLLSHHPLNSERENLNNDLLFHQAKNKKTSLVTSPESLVGMSALQANIL